MIATLLVCMALQGAVPVQTPAQPAVDPVSVLPVPGTDLAVRLEIAGLAYDPATVAGLRKNESDRLILTGTVGSKDHRLRVSGSPAGALDGAAWRKALLGDRIVGAGLFDVAGHACSETVRWLNPPYRDVDRQAFIVANGAFVHLHIVALENTDPEAFGRKSFDPIVASARFAVVRRGAWADLPARYLELSHEACTRADGLDWLAGLAGAEQAGWIERLVYTQHALAQRARDVDLAPHARAVLAHLGSIEQRTRSDRNCIMLAEDALGLALARAGDADGAWSHLQAALTVAKALDNGSQWGITMDLALARAAVGDVEGAFEHFADALDHDPWLRERSFRDPLFDPVRKDERIGPFLLPPRPPPQGQSLGH